MVQVGSRGAVLDTQRILLQLVVFNIVRDGASQISTDLCVLHEMMQREDGIRNHIRIVMEAAHPAVVCFSWVLLVEDVREVLLPSDYLYLMGHEALVEAHAHVTLQEVVTLVGEGCIGREETKSHSEFKIQAVFDVGLRETLQCGQAGPEGSDSPHLTTKLDLGDRTNHEVRAEKSILACEVHQLSLDHYH